MLRLFGRKGAIRRFGKARRGTAAIEFAIVAIPFFLLTFGLVEVSMIGFAQTSLDYAVSESARNIRTGRSQNEGVTYTEIRAELCDNLNSFLVVSCDGNLFLDVDRFNSFVDVNSGVAPIQDGVFQPNSFNYSPGAASDIVVVRAYYRWKIITPLFEGLFQNVADGERILVSTMMFRNEPF